jgi:type IV pilus assembly protein PilW
VLRPDGRADIQPIVRGVESFQVLFEVGDDRTGLPPNAAGVSLPNGVPETFRFVRADEVASLNLCNSQGTSRVSDTVNAWQSITAVRFGLVLRSEVGAREVPSAAETYFPLGESFASANDPGTIFVAPIDSRLRRVVTFTVSVRNRGGAMQTLTKACGEA